MADPTRWFQGGFFPAPPGQQGSMPMRPPGMDVGPAPPVGDAEQEALINAALAHPLGNGMVDVVNTHSIVDPMPSGGAQKPQGLEPIPSDKAPMAQAPKKRKKRAVP